MRFEGSDEDAQAIAHTALLIAVDERLKEMRELTAVLMEGLKELKAVVDAAPAVRGPKNHG